MKIIFLALILVCSAVTFAYAQENELASVSGRVTTLLGDVVENVKVQFFELEGISGISPKEKLVRTGLLNQELVANEVVGAWLSKALEAGYAKDIKITDLALMTSPRSDLIDVLMQVNKKALKQGAVTEKELIVAAEYHAKNDLAATIATAGIFIFADKFPYTHSNGGTTSEGEISRNDAVIYGGMVLVHERAHYVLGINTERIPVRSQLKFLRLFSSEIQNKAYYNQTIRGYTSQINSPTSKPSRRRRN